MIQTRFNTLYLCEIKFSKKPIGSKVIAEVEEKAKRLKVPKRFSIRPILIHVNKVIDFGQALVVILRFEKDPPEKLINILKVEAA